LDLVELPEERLQSGESESTVILRAEMKGLKERHFDVDEPARRENPRHFGSHFLRQANVLENAAQQDTGHRSRSKRQEVAVCPNVHTAIGSDVDIDDAAPPPCGPRTKVHDPGCLTLVAQSINQPIKAWIESKGIRRHHRMEIGSP
jgi:hypothetical protein